MMSDRPPNAAAGRPPDMTLPNVYRSPATPSIPNHPDAVTRKPVITSSMISTAPVADARDRSVWLNPGDDLLRQVHLTGGRRAERQPVDGGLPHGLNDLRVRVPEDHRAPRRDQVHVPVAIGVPQVGPGPLDHEPRRPTHGLESPDRR